MTRPDPIDDPRVAAALSDYKARLDAGHRPDPSAFAAEYPDLAPVLAGCIRAIEFVHGAVGGPAASGPPEPRTSGYEPGRVIGDFRILREVGRGGMGVVYEAEQLSLGRRVALKVLPAAAQLDDRALRRFRHEAQAAAALQHPRIVPVYAVGHDGGVHYLAMQYVDGRSLADVVTTLKTAATPGAVASTDTGSPPSSSPDAPPAPTVRPPFTAVGSRDHYREAARLIAQAADALQHAHEFGVVHRDVKPGNLLLDAKGDVWVADFGLARLPDSDLTGTTDVMGTVQYMSPEQAAGRGAALDGRTDVYSLGVTLYELLTLTPAFAADDRRALLRKVLEEEPVAPRTVAPAVPVDLETIVRTAMAKDPAERYQTARALADDLTRFLEDRPITARPPTLPKRAGKWAKRNRVLVGVSGSVVLAALVVLVGVLIASNAVIGAKRQQAEEALGRESVALTAETEAKGRIAGHLAAEQQARAGERRTVYLHTVALAYREWQAGNIERAIQLLDSCPSEHRVWEWYYLSRLVRPDWGAVPATQAGAMKGLGITPDGSIVIVDTTGRWLASVGNEIRREPGEAHAPTNWTRATVSPNGRVVAEYMTPKNRTGAQTQSGFATYDLKTGMLLKRFAGHAGGTLGVVFSPNGRRLASYGPDECIKVWNTESGALVTAITGHNAGVMGIVFHPDRNLIASYGSDYAVRIWEADTGQSIRVIRDARMRYTSEEATWGLRDNIDFRPDASVVAIGLGDGRVLIWDATTGNLRHSFTASPARVAALRFSPDGRWLATVGRYDTTVRLWSTSTGKAITVFRGHDTSPNLLRFDPAGRYLVSAHVPGGDVRVWDLTTLQEGRALVRRGMSQSDVRKVRPAAAVTFDRDGRRLIVARPEDVAVWEPNPGRLLGAERADPSAILAAAFAPDNRGVTLVSTGGGLIWEPTGSPPRPLFPFQEGRGRAQTPSLPSQPAPVEPGQVEFAGDGSRFVAIGPTFEARVHNATGAAERTLPTALGSSTYYVAMNRRGTRVAGVGSDGVVSAWDVSSGELLWRSAPLGRTVVALAFDPAGVRLAVGASDGTVGVLGSDGRLLRIIQGSGAPVLCLTFSTDGERLAAGLGNPLDPFIGVRVWDTDSGLELVSVPLPNAVIGLAFRPDDRMLAALAYTGRVWLLDGGTTPPEAVAEARRHRWAVWHDIQAADAESNREWWVVRWYLDRMIVANPGDAALLARRAGVLARIGQFSELTPKDAVSAVDTIGIDDLEPVYHLTVRLLEAGESAAYRRLCERLIATVPTETQLLRVSLIYRVCTLGPDGLADLRSAAEDSAKRLKKYTPFGLHYVTGVVLYRTGDYAAARKELLEGEKFEPASASHAIAWLYLAMIAHHQDQPYEARKLLAKADDWYAQNAIAPKPGAKKVEYQVVIPFPVLRREAAALLGVN